MLLVILVAAASCSSDGPSTPSATQSTATGTSTPSTAAATPATAAPTLAPPTVTSTPAPAATPAQTATPTPTPPPTPPCEQSIAVPEPSDQPDLVGDCEILLEAKDTLAGAAGLNWSGDQAITTWEGITVNEGRVTRIELPARGLDGSIPPALGGLSHLGALNLADNALTGRIPSALLGLEQLQGVNLAGNSLIGRLRPADESGVRHSERRRYSYIPLRPEATAAMVENVIAGGSIAFQGAASATVREAFAEEFANAVTFVADRYGIAASPGATMLVLDDIRGTSYRRDTRVIALTEGFLKSVAHEYVHDIQNDLSDGRFAPRWLTEGMAVYFANSYHDATGYATLSEQRDSMQRYARGVPDPLKSTEGVFRSGDIENYGLGLVAVEYLVSLTSEDALWDFYRRLASSPSWQESFSEAFGMTAAEFYAAFEPHRAHVAPPLPTISGAVVGPDGDPAAGFAVFAVSYPNAVFDDSVRSDTSTSDGTFSVASESGQRMLSVTRVQCGHMGFLGRGGGLVRRPADAASFEIESEDVTGVVITLPVDPELSCEPTSSGRWLWEER